MSFKRFLFFPLWELEKAEQFLEEMEQKGCRLIHVKFSYWFIFKESVPKKTTYFLSYKSFLNSNMDFCDSALLTNHKAHPIESNNSYYSVYRTKEEKNELTLLYEGRMDFIKKVLFERVITILFCLLIFLLTLFAALKYNSIGLVSGIVFGLIGIIFSVLLFYNLYGYYKQRKKCKQYERGMN